MKKYMKLIGSMIIMMCIALGVMCYVNDSKAATETVVYLAQEGHTADGEAGYTLEDDIPVYDGYLFAGYYEKSDSPSVPIKDISNLSAEAYVAKFVPKEVLGIKAQVSGNVLKDEVSDTTKNMIRFVTTIDDSLDYQKVGFEINVGGYANIDAEVDEYVFERIYAVGAKEATQEVYEPSIFHTASKYFKTWTFTNVPEEYFNTDITVTPYWITMDGTRVSGTTAIRTANYCRGWFYVSSDAYDAGAANLGTMNSPATLETAVAIPVDTTLITPKVYVIDDIQIKEKVVLNNSAQVVLQNEANSVTITRGTGTTMFDVAAGGSLTIDGKITVDGNKLASVKGPSMIKNAGNFVLGAEATLQNAETAGTTDVADNKGAALYNTGTANIYGNVKNNKAYDGGAIYNDGNGTVTLDTKTGASISGNRVTHQGGAIFVNRGTLTADGYSFTDNQAYLGSNGYGGAIYINAYRGKDTNKTLYQAKAVLKNCVFGEEGKANKGWSGGAIFLKGSLEADNCTFQHNETASLSGGAIALNEDVEKYVPDFTITNSRFIENYSKGNGGAIDINSGENGYGEGNFQISDCHFSGNRSGASAAAGGNNTLSVRAAYAQLHVSDITFDVTDGKNNVIILHKATNVVGISGSIKDAAVKMLAVAKIQVNGMVDSNITIKPSTYTENTELVRFAEGILENDKESIARKLVVDQPGYYINKDGQLKQQ